MTILRVTPQRTPVRCAIVAPQPSGWRDQMTAFIVRREFITLLGGATAGKGTRAAGGKDHDVVSLTLI